MNRIRELYRDSDDLRLALGIAAFLAVIVLLWSVVPHHGAKVRGSTVIRYWTGWGGDELQTLKDIISEFNRQQSRIYVNVVHIPSAGSGIYQKTRIALAGDDTPDVCSTMWSEELPEYAARGYLEPLGAYMKRSGRSLSEYLFPVRKVLQYDGKTHALAITVDSQFIVYNRALLREVVWDPDRFPETVQQMDKLADKLDLRDKSGSFIRYGSGPAAL